VAECSNAGCLKKLSSSSRARRDSDLQNILMINAEDRDRIFNHLFSQALREVRETDVARL
jgi:hypothetical protein